MFRILFVLGALIALPGAAQAQQAIVSFTFDDVPKSVMEVGFPILEKYGMRATLYVSTRSTEENEEYMSWNDIDRAAKAEWEVAAHTHTHPKLTLLTDEQIVEEIQTSMALFKEHGYTPEHFASPHGQFDDRVLSILKSHYRSHRTAWPLGKNTVHPDPYRIVSYFIRWDTSLKDVETLLDDLRKDGGWVVFQLHHLYPKKGGMVTEEYGTYLFEDIVELVRAKGLSVRTVGEALMELSSNKEGRS